MFFSLIIGTLNRSTELQICLDSLLNQTMKDFEIIIIDQSENSQTYELINDKKYKNINIKYFNVIFKGLSKARNYGLKKATGQFFALIDDDASYEKDYLLYAQEILQIHDDVILTGNMVSRDGKEYYRYTKETKTLSLRNIIRNAPSPGLVFPMELIRTEITFDEQFGVGAKYGACEETDLILEALDRGYKVVYVKKMKFVHPTIDHTYEIENSTKLKRIENYAVGFGGLIAKDRIKRKTNRLMMIRIEKTIKLFIKSFGVLGVTKKKEAICEKRGMFLGIHEYENFARRNNRC